ncbi:MAG: zinc metalloprotease HtpX [Chloroflexota bacterium]
MRTRGVYGRDTELSVRMFFVLFMLAALYLAFIAVFFYAGVDYSAILIVAVVLLGIQYFFSDQLVLTSMGARVVSPEQAPELHDIIDRLSQMADLPKPKVAVVDNPMPNAFATGRDPNHSVVAVTTGLLNRLERDEIMSVLGHELSHVKNRDAMVMTLASFFATVAFFVMRSGMFFGGGYGRRRDRGGGGLALIYLASLVVWLISWVLIRALSRYREYAADRGSAIITGAPMTLATALQKISGDMARIPDRDLREVQGMNAFFIIPAISGQSVMELFSTHPSLQHRLDRLTRLQQQMEGSGPR